MSWFKKIAEIDFPLSLVGMSNFLKQIQNRQNIPGQQYLFEGPEIADLRILRSATPETRQKLIKMIHYMNLIFEKFGDEMHKEVSSDIDHSDELEYTVTEYADMYLQDYDFSDEDSMFSFLGHLDSEGQQTEAWRNALKFNEVPNQRDFNQWMGSFREWAQKVSQAGWDVDESKLNEVIRTWQEANEYQQSYYQADEAFYDALADFTSEVMIGVIDYQNASHYRNRREAKPEFLPEENIPPWIDGKQLKKTLLENSESELTDWYIQNNSQWLLQSALDSAYEQDAENFSEFQRELDHEFGFDIIEFFSSNWDYGDDEIISEDFDEDDDYRLSMTVSQLSNAVDSLSDKSWIIRGADEPTRYAAMLCAAIFMIGNSDETLKFVFSHDLNSTSINEELIGQAIREAAEKNNEGNIPEELQTEEIKKLVEETKRFHESLKTEQQQSSPEQLQQMKDLGLAKRPFPHSYVLERGTYPGAGCMKMPKRFEPFRISVAPLQEKDPKTQEPKIPHKLLQDMSLHRVGKPYGLPSLGWIGGYADYGNRIFYITEVQSDVMQRTVHMRDPKKLEKMRRSEIVRIQNEIAKSQKLIQNPVSPKEKIKQTIDRINQENQQLIQQNADPKKIEDNKRKIDQMLTGYQNAPDVVDVSKLQEKINNLNQQLQGLQGKARDFESEGGYYKSFSQWHDYKSKVENTFKEWVPIFFNIAIREAKQRGFETVRIISAESLQKLWSAYARPQTAQLFKRIYDDTAKQYGAASVVDGGKNWFEIPTEQAKVASRKNKMNGNSWFKKAMPKLAEHEWLTQMPGGKQVWQIHLDKFFEIMKRKSPELQPPEFGGNEFTVNEGNREVFRFWLEEVPEELKFGNELEPSFKEAVREYLRTNYQFDPYEHEEEEDATPTIEDLESWWGE